MSEQPDSTEVPGNDDVLNPPLEREVTDEVIEDGAERDADPDGAARQGRDG